MKFSIKNKQLKKSDFFCFYLYCVYNIFVNFILYYSIMKFLKILLYFLRWLLFAFIFMLIWVILVYIWRNNSISIQTYQIPTITMNVWTGDRSVNQLPTLETISLSFPQYGWSNVNINESISDCSNVRNIVIKVTAINPVDMDWNISRMKFYYYDVDDPDTILEYKENWTFSPYAYFILPKMEKEYRFWVILYDNNWWVVDSEDIIWKWPVVYIPASCGDLDVPIVTLKIDSTDVKVWDTVTYTIKSRVESDNKAFEKDRTFYYDFDGNWTWDLVTKKDSAEYVFEESYENWITPREAN